MPPDAPTLTFDTSGPFCAVHVTGAAPAVEPMTTGQSERLFALVHDRLAAAGAGLPDLGLIAVGRGPGNFTGTRIGISAARGLALALGIRAVGVSRLEALLSLAPGPALIAAYKGHAYEQEAGGEPALLRLDGLPPGRRAQDDSLPPLPGARVIPMTALLPAMADLAAGQEDAPPPAPLYLRPPDAALPADPPPVILP